MLLSLFLVHSCNKSTSKETAPEKVITAFTKQFPEAKEVEWSKENDEEWEAEFELNDNGWYVLVTLSYAKTQPLPPLIPISRANGLSLELPVNHPVARIWFVDLMLPTTSIPVPLCRVNNVTGLSGWLCCTYI